MRDRNLPYLDYMGFVEGDDIGKGTVDVVVTEGFAGNIALKTAEGTARQLAGYLRSAMSRTIWARIGYLFARGAFRTLAEKMDPRRANGGVFLGLNGVVIKSHGGTDAEGFAAAIDIGYDMVRYELLAKISADAQPRAARRGRTDRGGSGVVIIRSVILGAGCYLPQRILTNAELAQDGRHLRRMDCAAHGHPPAPHRGGRRVDIRSRIAMRRARRWPTRKSTPKTST